MSLSLPTHLLSHPILSTLTPQPEYTTPNHATLTISDIASFQDPQHAKIDYTTEKVLEEIQAGWPNNIAQMKRKYKMPLFYNHIIATSNLSSEVRDTIEKTLTRLGAKTTRDYSQKNTLLITAIQLGEKYHVSRKWKKPCAKPEYIQAAIQCGYLPQITADFQPNAPTQQEIENSMVSKAHDTMQKHKANNDSEDKENGDSNGKINGSVISFSDSTRAQHAKRHFGNFDFGGLKTDFASRKKCRPLPDTVTDFKRFGKEGSGNPPSDHFRTPRDIFSIDEDSRDSIESSIQAWCPEVPLQKPLVSDSIFDGMTFALEISDQELLHAAIDMVQRHSGIVNMDWEVDHKADYLIVRHKSKDQINAHGAKVLTDQWLEACDWECKFLSPASHILFTPLDIDTPLPEFTKFTISLTGFEDPDRERIFRTIKILGAAFEPGLSRACTHLICKETEGKKFETAIRWKIPVISVEWLWDCAIQGWALDLKSYLLKKPASLSSEPPPVSTVQPQLSSMLSRRESLLPPPGPNGCLRGVFVALSNRVLAKRSLIIELCKRTGAIFIGAFAPKCTHLIHSGSVHEPAMSREMQAAQLAGKKIVHPAWLEACRDTNQHQPEIKYPFNYNPLKGRADTSPIVAPALPPLIVDVPSPIPQDYIVEETMLPPTITALPAPADRRPSVEPISFTQQLKSILAEADEKREAVSTNLIRSAQSRFKNRFPIAQSGPATFAMSQLPVSREADEEDEVTYRDPSDHNAVPRTADTTPKKSPLPEIKVLDKPDVIPVQKNSPPTFLLSAMDASEKSQTEETIKTLGGIYEDSAYWKINCTHLVIGYPARNEKFLAACAAGKWCLKPGYITACRQAGKFIDPTPFEWRMADAKCSADKELVEAGRKWRLRTEENKDQKCFIEWNALLVVEQAKSAAYERLIIAGGGKAITKSGKLTRTKGYTHILVDTNTKARSWVTGLTCQLLDLTYVADFLIRSGRETDWPITEGVMSSNSKS